MRRAIGFCIALLVTLIPGRYRRWWPATDDDMISAGLVSGILQLSISFGLFLASYLNFFQRRVTELYMLAEEITAGAPTGMSIPVSSQALGAATTAEFLLRPSTWLLLYFTAEGTIRLLAALGPHEVVGSLPLHLVGNVHDRFRARNDERRLGPIIPDRVQAVEGKRYDLLVGASRPKPAWNRHITIRYRDELYEVLKESRGQGAHNFLYELRVSPAGRVTRKIEDYEPETGPLTPGSAAAPPAPGDTSAAQRNAPLSNARASP